MEMNTMADRLRLTAAAAAAAVPAGSKHSLVSERDQLKKLLPPDVFGGS
jgi:hypothetical protein